jgi:hypothetical protein
MPEFGSLDRKPPPAIEEVKAKRAVLADQGKTGAGRQLTRTKEQKAQADLINKVDLPFSLIDELIVELKATLGGAKYMILDLGPNRDPSQSKIDKQKLSFSEWTAAHVRYVGLRRRLDVS